MSNQSNTSLHEVDATNPAPMYRLLEADLMQRLMQRTGTGAKITIRELAEAVGVPHGTIGNLLTGEQARVPHEVAHAISAKIGVDLLILFAPTGRSSGETAPTRIAAVSA
ncbi:helix-turn-helix domain-containing protein [Streptomyces samsunensis]|uniref:helix-turn-helix domain-containing protein n=1 Tax=Streptomyces malaysiensis TaxID=92644 RepID=UPI00158405BE|nr:helix-turn-helix domain-containing protein [Streptomyces samsunensis]NUH35322.1 helix-turn-helix domain-containing protein [Streptomyces samsunensis]